MKFVDNFKRKPIKLCMYIILVHVLHVIKEAFITSGLYNTKGKKYPFHKY